jgi:phospholipid/cholesterol/gamma-HCH transport system substrate-binding protein
MKQNVIETLLGAFVLIVAVCFFVYGSGQANVGNNKGGYNIKAQFTDVKISGVAVGTVAAIDLDPVLYNADVTLSMSNDVELPYDTAARISSEGLLGGTYLALDVGGDTEMLEDGDLIAITQSAQNLEQLLGQFIFSLQDAKDE